MSMIRFDEIINLEVMSICVLPKLLNLFTYLLTNILLARNNICFPLVHSILRMSMFLALLYVLGLATAMCPYIFLTSHTHIQILSN